MWHQYLRSLNWHADSMLLPRFDHDDSEVTSHEPTATESITTHQEPVSQGENEADGKSDAHAQHAATAPSSDTKTVEFQSPQDPPDIGHSEDSASPESEAKTLAPSASLPNGHSVSSKPKAAPVKLQKAEKAYAISRCVSFPMPLEANLAEYYINYVNCRQSEEASWVISLPCFHSLTPFVQQLLVLL